MYNPWIGVDLDGTLAKLERTSPWNGVEIGEPIKPMCDLVRSLLSNGVRVKIFTARASHNSVGHRGHLPVEEQILAIEKWSIEHLGQPLEVTAEKDYEMVCLIDDRAIGVMTNTGKVKTQLECYKEVLEAEEECSR